jgi:uncharacterized damage-inducible protein DinB
VTPEELLRRRAVQRYEQTGMEILVHVVEHFSYHTGQISLHAKIIKGVDLNHYPDLKRGVEP